MPGIVLFQYICCQSEHGIVLFYTFKKFNPYKSEVGTVKISITQIRGLKLKRDQKSMSNSLLEA